MFKPKIKCGDEVTVISGSHRGQKGKVLQVIKDTQRVIVEGVNMLKHFQKKTDKQQGGILEREGSLHYSNVMLTSRLTAKKSKK